MNLELEFEWNERKSLANLRKHKIDFDTARKIFAGYVTIDPDTREDYGEERWVATGLIGDRAVVVVFVIPGADRIRLISARKASMEEREKYEEAIKKNQTKDELEGI